MPLMEGKSRKVVSKNMKEMMESKTFGKKKGGGRHGAKKRRKMAIAAALEKAGKSKKY